MSTAFPEIDFDVEAIAAAEIAYDQSLNTTDAHRKPVNLLNKAAADLYQKIKPGNTQLQLMVAAGEDSSGMLIFTNLLLEKIEQKTGEDVPVIIKTIVQPGMTLDVIHNMYRVLVYTNRLDDAYVSYINSDTVLPFKEYYADVLAHPENGTCGSNPEWLANRNRLGEDILEVAHVLGINDGRALTCDTCNGGTLANRIIDPFVAVPEDQKVIIVTGDDPIKEGMAYYRALWKMMSAFHQPMARTGGFLGNLQENFNEALKWQRHSEAAEDAHTREPVFGPPARQLSEEQIDIWSPYSHIPYKPPAAHNLLKAIGFNFDIAEGTETDCKNPFFHAVCHALKREEIDGIPFPESLAEYLVHQGNLMVGKHIQDDRLEDNFARYGQLVDSAEEADITFIVIGEGDDRQLVAMTKEADGSNVQYIVRDQAALENLSSIDHLQEFHLKVDRESVVGEFFEYANNAYGITEKMLVCAMHQPFVGTIDFSYRNLDRKPYPYLQQYAEDLLKKDYDVTGLKSPIHHSREADLAAYGENSDKVRRARIISAYLRQYDPNDPQKVHCEQLDQDLRQHTGLSIEALHRIRITNQYDAKRLRDPGFKQDIHTGGVIKVPVIEGEFALDHTMPVKTSGR